MTATESGFFFSLAALSLSFVGFSAVVVSLRGALGGEISDRHLRLVRLYIEGGLIVTALALIPALLNILHVSEAGRFPPWVVIINVLSFTTDAGLWLNAAGIPFQPFAGRYAVALMWALCVFGFIFVRTIDIFLQRARA
jgi:hypothetical protein